MNFIKQDVFRDKLRDRFLSNCESWSRKYPDYVGRNCRECIVPALADEEMRFKILDAFDRGSGGELRPGKNDKPPKMHAVYSSSAQCVNLFAHLAFYGQTNPALLQDIFGIIGREYSFEKKLPVFDTCLKKHVGGVPNLDFAMWNEDEIVGVESKLFEIYDSHHDQTIQSVYFYDSILNADAALMKIAESIHTGVMDFRYLNAAQLVKHVLGLKSSGKHWQLLYVYNELASCEAHEDELNVFTDAMLKAGLPFKSMTYQKMVRVVKQHNVGENIRKHLAWFEHHYL